ncbi:MAG: UDP-N-acetylmuramate--L-alanine ligase [Christensenellales bacterium]|jgi:UDP-N-acetylmuramate--alanine ligase
MVHIDDYKGKHIFFIGIGGCSMSGLAHILHQRGYQVSGSDRNESNFTRFVRNNGIDVYIGHDPAHLQNVDLVVYSAAIKPDNPERAYAAKHGIPQMDRARLLGQLSSQFPVVIGIAGCHGKTTITSMLALIMQLGQMDSTIHIGGETAFLDAGVSVGKSDIFLTEACEYVESFLQLAPTAILVNNIDDDHLDYFKDLKEICDVFHRFVQKLPPTGLLFGCSDDPLVSRLMMECACKTVSYGLSGDGDYVAANIRYDTQGKPSFDCLYKGDFLFNAKLDVVGKHNVQNALGAIAVARHFGVSDAVIVDALAQYRLAKRRFEYYGDMGGVQLYHDYAHHPSEIMACLNAASKVPHQKLWVIFQCNSYSRAITLFDKYALAFEDADTVIIPDIYPGRETDTGLIHATDLAKGIKKSCKDTMYIPTFAEIRDYLKQYASAGDIVLALGSGDVYMQIRQFLQ